MAFENLRRHVHIVLTALATVHMGTQWRPGEPIRYTDSLLVGRTAVRTPARARHSVPLQSGPEATQRLEQWVPGLSRGNKTAGAWF